MLTKKRGVGTFGTVTAIVFCVLIFLYGPALFGLLCTKWETRNAPELWIVPILLTSPGYGTGGEVGVVAIDARTGLVVGSTPRSEVVASAKRLREAKRDELETAFLRARTV